MVPMSDPTITPPGESKTRVLLANSNALICQGLETLLDSIENLQVVATATTTEEGLRLVAQTEPNLVITDVKTKQLDGILIAKTVKEKFPETKILMLTANEETEQIFDALCAGADGYCLNGASLEKLKKAVQSVIGGIVWLDHSITATIKKGVLELRGSKNRKNQFAAASDLTEREIEVLRLVSTGFTNQKIAEQLDISAETVKTHIRHIMRKLAVTDRTQAAVMGLKRRIVP
jgi:two-component system, NarL family, response regulator LiaR